LIIEFRDYTPLENFQKFSVEEPGQPGQNLCRVTDRISLPVGPVTGKGIEHIGNCRNPGFKRDRLA